MARTSMSAFLISVLLLAATSVFAQSDEKIEEAIEIFNRGKSLHQEQRYAEAINEYRRAAKLDENNPFVYNAIGLAQASLGSFDEALKAFARALQINPDLTDVYNNMGMAYAESGQRDKAFEAFGRAVRNPSYPTPEKALYNIGNLYLQESNFELAMMHFKRAVEKNPEFSLGHRGLGNTHLRMGETESAMREFEKALEISEEDVESLFQLARILEERGEAEAASELYRRVVEVDRFSAYGELALKNLDSLKSKS